LTGNSVSDFPRKSWAFLLFMLFFACIRLPAYSNLNNLHLLDPYFGQTGRAQIGLQYGNLGIKNGFLHYLDLSLDYGVNDNLCVGVNLPYLFISGAQDGGALGNMNTYLKFSILQRDTAVFRWRLIGELFFRFATGVMEEDSIRVVGANRVSYYPFSSATPSFSPAVMNSFLFNKWIINITLRYVSESALGEGIFDFNLNHDRFDAQISVDYFFRFDFQNEKVRYLIIRPVAYLDYKLNLTPVTFISDTLTTVFEANFKLDEVIRWKFYFALPLYTTQKEYSYEIGAQISKSI